MQTPQKLTCLLFFAALFLPSFGCCGRLLPGKAFATREKIEEVQQDEPKKNVAAKEREIETILQIGGKARRITASSDAKRVLIEREPFLEDDSTPGADSKAPNASDSPSNVDDDLNVELWNVEFSTAEQEEFRPNEFLLTLQKSNCAAFSTQGDRLFWLAREQVYDESQAAENADGFFGASAPSFELRNVLLTKEIKSFNPQDEFDAERSTQDASVKHVKTDDAVKTSTRLRLSPNARWLIYRSLQTASSASDSSEKAQTPTSEETSKTDFLYDVPSWLLVYVPDRKRVVHFPETVKMTFDSSTSDDNIEGRVVEILDVSDSGDLVATLVEELPQEAQKEDKKETTTNDAPKQTQNWNPRYKIVVWDLEIMRTIDLEKKRSPLYALEVSQIPLKSPIAPRDCHFSTDGKVLAAKVEPRLISVWQTANGRLKGEFWEDDGYIRDFALAANGMRLVAGVGDKEGELLLWNVRTCALQDDVRLPQTKSIDAVTFFNSDACVLFVDSEGDVKRWNVDDARR